MLENFDFESLKNASGEWQDLSARALRELDLSPDEIDEIEMDVINLTRELIAIPSVNFGEGKGDEVEIANFVSKKLFEVGIENDIVITGEKIGRAHV